MHLVLFSKIKQFQVCLSDLSVKKSAQSPWFITLSRIRRFLYLKQSSTCDMFKADFSFTYEAELKKIIFRKSNIRERYLVLKRQERNYITNGDSVEVGKNLHARFYYLKELAHFSSEHLVDFSTYLHRFTASLAP
jgi:hypothetical protein